MKEVNALTQVSEFHRTFEHPIRQAPVVPENERVQLRYNLLKEEVEEFLEAAQNQDIVGVADALADIQYVLSGAVLEFGLQEKFAELFDEVHRSNMSKACVSEQEAFDTVDAQAPVVCFITKRAGRYFVYRSDDKKTIKSINYSPADIKGVLNK